MQSEETNGGMKKFLDAINQQWCSVQEQVVRERRKQADNEHNRPLHQQQLTLQKEPPTLLSSRTPFHSCEKNLETVLAAQA